MCVRSIKVPIRKKYGNLFNDPRIYMCVCVCVCVLLFLCTNNSRTSNENTNPGARNLTRVYLK